MTKGLLSNQNLSSIKKKLSNSEETALRKGYEQLQNARISGLKLIITNTEPPKLIRVLHDGFFYHYSLVKGIPTLTEKKFQFSFTVQKFIDEYNEEHPQIPIICRASNQRT